MIVVIHQPDYLPWLGFFDRLDKSDLFVILDDVQFIKRGYHNRNRIKTPKGWQWLTVPVVNEFPLPKLNRTRIDNNSNWRKQHWTALRLNYGRSPFFNKYADFFEETYERNWGMLSELNIYLIRNLMDMLGLNTPVIKSSSLNVAGRKTELMVNICKEVGADTYLSGTGAKDYLIDEEFDKAGLKLIYQNFIHPTYRQRFGDFQPYMSIVDLLFNCGDNSLEVIRGKVITE